MSGGTLVDQVRSLFDRVQADPRGRAVLQMYDHTINFNVLDGDDFHVVIKEGEVQVKEGGAPATPLLEAHEIRANTDALKELFSGELRLSDAVEEKRMFPTAAHTAKRHIDRWLVKLVNIGLGKKTLRELY